MTEPETIQPAQVDLGILDRYEVAAHCLRCLVRAVTHEPCCSSHGKPLCCECYRRTHFVEVGACCAKWAATHQPSDEGNPQ